jgi:hypothetical protein
MSRRPVSKRAARFLIGEIIRGMTRGPPGATPERVKESALHEVFGALTFYGDTPDDLHLSDMVGAVAAANVLRAVFPTTIQRRRHA